MHVFVLLLLLIHVQVTLIVCYTVDCKTDGTCVSTDGERIVCGVRTPTTTYDLPAAILIEASEYLVNTIPESAPGSFLSPVNTCAADRGVCERDASLQDEAAVDWEDILKEAARMRRSDTLQLAAIAPGGRGRLTAATSSARGGGCGQHLGSIGCENKYFRSRCQNYCPGRKKRKKK